MNNIINLLTQEINQHLQYIIYSDKTLSSTDIPDKYSSSLVNQALINFDEMIAYSVLAPGKRLRPLLVCAGSLLGCAPSDGALNIQITSNFIKSSTKAKPELFDIACAIELIHCYSLVHDDLPAMDNDNLRRGQPTSHVKYGEDNAILVGDALQSLAFEILSVQQSQLPTKIQLKIIGLIAKASGRYGMVGGQFIDCKNIRFHEIEDLRSMHLLKTGMLIDCSIITGYLYMSNINSTYLEDTLEKVKSIATKIGLLFQIVDDIIDVTGNTTELGKTANKDLRQNKTTYVSIGSLERAREFADRLYHDIHQLLQELDNGALLKLLVDQIYLRNK